MNNVTNPIVRALPLAGLKIENEVKEGNNREWGKIMKKKRQKERTVEMGETTVKRKKRVRKNILSSYKRKRKRG